MDKLFRPNLEESQQYGEKLSKLFYKLDAVFCKDYSFDFAVARHGAEFNDTALFKRFQS